MALSKGLSLLLVSFALGALVQAMTGFPLPLSPAGSASGGEGPGAFARLAPHPQFVPDPIVGHKRIANTRLRIEWPEHPAGHIWFQTNNLAFREDADTTPTPRQAVYRVLVTGDSHTDGLVFNSEAFPNALERDLNADDQTVECEVINGAVCFYGPHNYLGVLQKHIDLDPALFVVVVYCGNDFINTASAAKERLELSIAGRHPGYQRKLKQFEGNAAIAQGLNQAYFFASRPDLEPLVVDIATEQFATIQRICAQRGIDVVVLFLPTKMDIEWPREARFAADKAKLLAGLALDEADLETNLRLSAQLRRRLEGRGISCLDLTPALQATTGKVFWDNDYHLNPAGHAAVAREFIAKFGDLIPRQ